MGLLRRVTLSIAAAVSMLAALTVVSVGAAGGFGQAPGHYTFDDTSASASFFNPVDQSNQNVSVDRSLFKFKPKGGGPSTTQRMTVLSVNIFTPAPFCTRANSVGGRVEIRSVSPEISAEPSAVLSG